MSRLRLNHRKLSRRSFMKGAASAGFLLSASSLLTPGIVKAQTPRGPVLDAQEVFSASHWGAFKARVEGGRFVQVIPWEKDPYPTSILQGLPDAVYSTARIKYPFVREGFLKRGRNSDTAERGRGNFVRVSWDEALGLVSQELTRIKETYGNSSIFGGSYGWQSAGNLHSAVTLMQRMLNLHGGFTGGIGDYSTGASQVIMPHVMGTLEVYEQQTVWPVVIENAKLVVVWGADPVTTNKIGYGIPDHEAYLGLQGLKEKGTEVIVIDPVRNNTAEYFGGQWIAPRAGTDVAMMLGVMHTLYTENLHDQAFLDKYTTGFDLFKAYLTGERDGQPKTAEWAASIVNVDAETIKTLARKMASTRTMLMSGWGIQRRDHGEQVHWALVTLASMLGQIGLPGGGFGLSYHYANGGSPSANAPYMPGITSAVPGMPGGLPSIPVARVVDMLLNPGQTIDFNGRKITYPDIKMVYWVGGNPFHHHQDRNRMIGAWRRPETIVVQDIYWTATAKFADIVLPATTSYERNDIAQGGDYSGKFIVAMHKVVDPVFESRSDFDIFADLSNRLGYGASFTEGKDEISWIRSFYEVVQQQAPAFGLDVPDFDAFWNEQSILEFPIPDSARQFVRYAKFRENPLENPLGTPSGKIEIYSKTIEGFGYDDCPPHATWIEPIEWLGSEKTKQYPLDLVSSHPEDRLHSQLNSTWLHNKYEVRGREPVWIHPQDADARGIKNGDLVRIFNDRGQLLAGAIVTDRVSLRTLKMQEGAWYDPLDGGSIGTLCKHGDVNVLTIDKGTSKLAQANIAQTTLVEVEKYTGSVPQVTAYTPPDEA